MNRDFEYVNYSESERLAMLESRAAELERMLGRVAPEYAAEQGTGQYPAIQHEAPEHVVTEHLVGEHARRGVPGRGSPAPAHAGAGRGTRERGADGSGAAGRHARGGGAFDRAASAQGAAGYTSARYDQGAGDGDLGADFRDLGGGYHDPDIGYCELGADSEETAWYQGTGTSHGETAGGYAQAQDDDAEASGDWDGGAVNYGADDAREYGAPQPGEPDERTEVLINRGRRNAPRQGRAGWLKHWRAIAIGAAGLAVGCLLLAVILPGGTASWPASVARVQSEITVACQNPNVVSEPSQVNFACAKDTRQILWVFSLLTSGDNPNFTDPSNGRKGLEPISPAQGGDVAWSLNLHHPYDPASPTDSLEVAARAINDIIGGATLTGSNGAPMVQPGLESNPANCARYTGSSALITRAGFPAICALSVTSSSGQAALVSDVFEQWMVGTPTQIATEAAVLFENADNPGDSRVQTILNSLPDSGL